VWSKYIQGTKTLYYSRKLRFDDFFAEQYKKLFDIEENKKLNMLEIGCGPGALSGALHRWYPNAVVTGIDRDSEFIRFARGHEDGITFLEGDAVALPFVDNSFDVVISNTVCEHIEPSKFYGEQLRVLKQGGICLVLSSRRGIKDTSDCVAVGRHEERFWQKVRQYDNTFDKYSVCRYAMSEKELPAVMERCGFRDVRTGFAAIDLTPDHPDYPAVFAHQIIDAERYSDLECIDSVLYTMPEHVTQEEAYEMKCIINKKYDARIALYDCDEKQWDTNVSIIMVLRGVKPAVYVSALP